MKGQGGPSTHPHRLQIGESSRRGGNDSVALVLKHSVGKVDLLEVWTAVQQVVVDDQQPEICLEFQGCQERKGDPSNSEADPTLLLMMELRRRVGAAAGFG